MTLTTAAWRSSISVSVPALQQQQRYSCSSLQQAQHLRLVPAVQPQAPATCDLRLLSRGSIFYFCPRCSSSSFSDICIGDMTPASSAAGNQFFSDNRLQRQRRVASLSVTALRASYVRSSCLSFCICTTAAHRPQSASAQQHEVCLRFNMRASAQRSRDSGHCASASSAAAAFSDMLLTSGRPCSPAVAAQHQHLATWRRRRQHYGSRRRRHERVERYRQA